MKRPILTSGTGRDGDNIVQPFGLQGMAVRGRLVRLGTTVDQILSAHNYPDTVATLLGECLTLTAMLGSMMKEGGQMTLQARAGGAVSMLVADYKSPGELRGYAQFDLKKVKALPSQPKMQDLLGDGYLAITLDPAGKGERYQGIVDIEGDTLARIAETYFQTSEQIPTKVILAVGINKASGGWRAGGLLVQSLANEGGYVQSSKLEGDDWNKASILAESVQEKELLDPALPVESLLFRLFHEDGVRVYDQAFLSRGCRCSDTRLKEIVDSLPPDEIRDIAENGIVEMTCEYCNKVFNVPVP